MRVLNSLSDLNVMRILRLIFLEKKISRVDIASKLGMDKSTVTKITSELSAKKLISEAEAGISGPQGGRKPVFLTLNAQYACSGGIEINPERFYAVITNFSGKVIFEYTEEIDPSDYKRLGLKGYFKKAYQIIKKTSDEKNIKLVGIGCGFPGLIDFENGKIIKSIPLMILKPVEFIKEIEKISDVPVFVDNDARCCCYTQKFNFEKSGQQKNIMYVLVQYRPQRPVKNSSKNISVGFAFSFNGKIYYGTDSYAGEFRSMLWKNTSKNQFLSGTTGISKLSDLQKVTPVFKELSKNVAFIVNTLNLDMVFVGGIDEKYTGEIVKNIKKDIAYLWPYGENIKPVIKSVSAENRLVSVGAALMVLDKLLCIPEFNVSRKGSKELSLELF